MEYALRVQQHLQHPRLQIVLILVLMEDALRETRNLKFHNTYSVVLILVLMEDTLRDSSINT